MLLPLAAVATRSLDNGVGGLWDAITAPAARAALTLTRRRSRSSSRSINVVAGTLIAWVLVRDEFPGKRFVNALIDLPFALPTIVASIVLLALYGPRSPIGLHLNATKPALVIALLFVTLPFVVRSVQPVLIEVDREAEQAAASLGAGNWTIFRRIVLPALGPALLSGAGLAFARAIGEFGSVVLIGGGIPRETEVASQYIAKQIEIDRPVNAAAVSMALLTISFAVLLVLRVVAARSRRHEAELTMALTADARASRCARSRSATSSSLLLVPLTLIFFRTFEDGLVAFWEQVTTPAAISAISLSLTIVAIVVPLNVVFGVVTALALARGRFRGRGIVQAIVDLPFAVSPVVVGVSLILLWGTGGWLGGARRGRLSGHLLAARDGARDDLRDAAVRRARGRAGAAGDRRRAGGGRRHARRLAPRRRSGGSRCRRSAGASSTASC